MIVALLVAGLVVLILTSFYCKSTNPICTSIERIEGKIVIVTGGTAGIGLEIAKDLARRGAKVIIACPVQKEGHEARDHLVQATGNDDIHFKLLDLASFSSVRKFADDILRTEPRLDVLVNNAGGFFDYVTEDGYSATVQINYLGHFLLTILLLPLLKKSKSSRIINTSSLTHYFGRADIRQLTKTDLRLLRAYSDAKAFIVLFTLKLSRLLAGTEVVANTTDPGVVGGTTLVYNLYCTSYISSLYNVLWWLFCRLYKNAYEGAQTAIHAAVDVQAGTVSGHYFKDCRDGRFSNKLKSDKLIEEVWIESKRLVKLSDKEVCF